MSEKIGYQNGIKAAMNRLRAIDPKGKSAYDKLERTLFILARDHDASIPATPPPPKPDPKPDPKPEPEPQYKYAPRTYNAVGVPGSWRANARFCTTGLPRNEQGQFYEPGFPHIRYDSNGLCIGGRNESRMVPGLKGADSMDGRSPCQGYGAFPPWPEESYLQ
jgi:hypothetical protein